MFHVKHAAGEQRGAARRTPPGAQRWLAGRRAGGWRGAAAGLGQSPCRAAEHAGAQGRRIAAGARPCMRPPEPGSPPPCQPQGGGRLAAPRPRAGRGAACRPPLLGNFLSYKYFVPIL